MCWQINHAYMSCFSPDKDPQIVSHTTIAKDTTAARIGGNIIFEYYF